jgi:hypothetical protein
VRTVVREIRFTSFAEKRYMTNALILHRKPTTSEAPTKF